MKMLMDNLAQMGNFCLAKSDAMWPMAQMATGSASLAKYLPFRISSIRLKKNMHFFIKSTVNVT